MTGIVSQLENKKIEEIQEAQDHRGVPNEEIQLLMSCLRGMTRAVVKDIALWKNPVFNAVMVSIRLHRSLNERDKFQKFIFFAHGSYVYVLECLSFSPMPEREDDFIFCASHDSGWFDDGTYRFQKLLKEGPYKKVFGIEEKIFYLPPGRFTCCRDKTVRHRVDIFGERSVVIPKAEDEK